MKIQVVTLGTFKSAELEGLTRNYLKLGTRYAQIEHTILQNKNALDKFFDKFPPRTFLTVLDERGKTFDSLEFARQVEKIKDGSYAKWVLAVSGPHGFSREILQRADLVLSLSSLTFPHELASAVLAEQLFRALSILNNHPYHHI